MNQFEFNQPKTGNDIKHKGDCMIRSIAIAINKPYKEVYDIMYDLGWRTNKHKSELTWEEKMTKTLEHFGYKNTYWESFPAIKGQKRITPKTFPYVNEGIYILRMAKHVCAFKGENYIDSWDCGHKCVYKALKII